MWLLGNNRKIRKIEISQNRTCEDASKHITVSSVHKLRKTMEQLKEKACLTIDENACRLDELSKQIWEHSELGYQEHRSHACLCQFLEDSGFHVERHYKLETAFKATWGTTQGGQERKPHVALLCEYDALPDVGHACGHNLIAEIGVGAALGVLEVLKQMGQETGRLSIIGTPAEEAGGGKIDLLNAGVFEDVDVAMMAHPAPFTDARPIFLGGKRLFANFHGRSSHAAGYPWEGVNALDAAVLAYVNISTLRQQMKPEWRAHVIIPKGGTRTNIIPSEAQLAIQVRAPMESDVAILEKKVKDCVHAAALASGCSVDIEDVPKPYGRLVTNETLAKLYETNASQVGVVFPPPTAPKKVLGSTDMGNISQNLPCLHPTYDCGTDAVNHTHEFAEAAASSSAQPPTLAQAKSLAMVALDIFQRPELLANIQADFQEDLKHL